MLGGGPAVDAARWPEIKGLRRLGQRLADGWYGIAHWRRQFIIFGLLGLLAAVAANWLAVTYISRTDLSGLQTDSLATGMRIAGRVPVADAAQAWAGGDESRVAVQRLNAFLWEEIWTDESHAAAHLLGPHGNRELRLIATAYKDASLLPDGVWTRRGIGDWSSPRIRWERAAGREHFRVFLPVRDEGGTPVAVLALDRSPAELARRRDRLYMAMAVGFGLFTLLWLGQAYWLAFLIGAPVDRMANAAAAVRGHGGTLVPTDRMGDLRPAAELINELTWASLERNRLHEALTRYVSGGVAQAVAEDPGWLHAGGRDKAVSVLFADIHHFTEISLSLPTPEVVDMLNRCFTACAQAVHRYNGMVDKFMGDGMMALFGALVDDPKHAEHAVLAALAMQKAIAELRQDLNQPSLRIGVGINSGRAIIGNIGSEDRFQFTAIGPTVNLASRLESFSRTIGGGVIIGYETAQKLDDSFLLERVDGARVKGVDQLLTLFKVKDHQRR